MGFPSTPEERRKQLLQEYGSSHEWIYQTTHPPVTQFHNNPIPIQSLAIRHGSAGAIDRSSARRTHQSTEEERRDGSIGGSRPLSTLLPGALSGGWNGRWGCGRVRRGATSAQCARSGGRARGVKRPLASRSHIILHSVLRQRRVQVCWCC